MKKTLKIVAILTVLIFAFQLSASAVYVIFNDEQGGSKIGGMEHVNGTVEITVEDPSREGYDFTGWATDDENIEIDGNELTSNYPQGWGTPATVYATWAETEYEIELNLNGGTIEGVDDYYTISSGDIEIPAPTREGYEFVTWLDEEGEEIGDTITFNSARTLSNRSFTAVWEAIVYNIEYDLDGGEVAEENPTTYTADDEFTLNNPTKDGYEFIGWTNEDGEDLGTSVTIEEGTTGDLTFIATWKEVKNPKTGDNIYAYVAIFALSVCGVAVCIKKLSK